MDKNKKVELLSYQPTKLYYDSKHLMSVMIRNVDGEVRLVLSFDSKEITFDNTVEGVEELKSRMEK